MNPGNSVVEPQRANIKSLVEAASADVRWACAAKALESCELSPQADVLEVLIDPIRFKQIVSNLLSNAIKFTHSAKVRLILSSARHRCAAGVNLLCVEDTGVGISDEDQRRLFSPFVQASNNTQSARKRFRSGVGD